MSKLSLGDRILDEIIKQGMVQVVPRAPGQDGDILVWNANAPEQLEAVALDYLQAYRRIRPGANDDGGLAVVVEALKLILPEGHGFILLTGPTGAAPSKKTWECTSSISRDSTVSMFRRLADSLEKAGG